MQSSPCAISYVLSPVQHLMNVAGEEGERRRYMAEMVAVYKDFVRVSVQVIFPNPKP